ncbi:MAG: DeoR family transcriptional regulator [Anaerolineales bacterium]|nr:DeoR family transcriptional regulator [Anaerolineae bacterium]MCA9973361.1 DeoR family transcriptional regulator [Anaerolineales bacterium]
MLPTDRRQQILAMLHMQGAVTITELSAAFAVSEMTIHRDLDRLATAGQLQKVRGGALPVDDTAVLPPLDRCVMCHKQPRRQTQVLLHAADGSQQRACCPHCGLMQLARSSAGIETMMVTGFLYGRTLTAPAAWYLLHPDIAICCTPTVLAFERREDAVRFQTGFGGHLANLADALAYVQQAMKLK